MVNAMYRIFSIKVLFVLIVWLAVGLFVLGQFLAGAATSPVTSGSGTVLDWFHSLWHSLAAGISSKLKWTAIPSLAWLLSSLLFCNPVWRWVWKKFPSLNMLIFPDLNGDWDVELCSNWPRHLQVLEAAQSSTTQLDMRKCDTSELAELTTMILRAEIYQTWWKIEMRLFNPAANSPIDRSDTINVEPFMCKGLRRAGIAYFYKQQNRTDEVTDDIEFFGAARLEYDTTRDSLEGLFWTARMWRRAMNTGGMIKFSRRPG
jgi:hypothetical protein